MTNVQANEFGRYLRRKRNEAGLSLRALAEKMEVSAVYLGEVERGVRGPINDSRWDDLIKAIPSISRDELTRLSMKSKPMQLNLSDSPPEYQNLAMALARRIEKQNLNQKDFTNLFSILDIDDE